MLVLGGFDKIRSDVPRLLVNIRHPEAEKIIEEMATKDVNNDVRWMANSVLEELRRGRAQ